MHVRRLALVLAVVSPLACATKAQREASLRIAPVNAPAGVLANGFWNGTMSYVPVLRPLAMDVVRGFTVQVQPVRDSVSLTFVFDGGGPAAGGTGTAAPFVGRTAGSGARARIRPRDVAVQGDTMSFRMFDWQRADDMRCRLTLGSAGVWDGPCLDKDGYRVATLQLGVPVARTASR